VTSMVLGAGASGFTSITLRSLSTYRCTHHLTPVLSSQDV